MSSRNTSTNGNHASASVPLSARETAVLERQRQMAAQLSGASSSSLTSKHKNSGTTTTTTTTTTTNHHAPTKRPNLPSALSTQKRLLQQAAQRKKLSATFAPPTNSTTNRSTSSNKSNHHVNDSSYAMKQLAASRIRPTQKKKASIAVAEMLEHPSSAADAVLAAKSRLGLLKQRQHTTTKRTAAAAAASMIHKHAKHSNHPASVTRLLQVATGGNITQALQESTKAASERAAAARLNRHYPAMEPDDYWKNIRDWDFLQDLNSHMRTPSRKNKNSQQQSSSSSQNEESSSSGKGTKEEVMHDKSTHKALPNQFESFRQYVGLWGPLVLQETRAQLLSEAVSDIPYWSTKPNKGPIPVTVQPMTRDVGGSDDFITVVIQSADGCSIAPDGGFYPNDIILLARDMESITQATKGKCTNYNTSFQTNTQKGSSHDNDDEPSLLGVNRADKRRRGLLGHTRHSRRTISGLQLKISRKLWPAVRSSDTMYMLKLGSNITSLREFTALCRLETCPLLPYLLGKQREGGDSSQRMPHIIQQQQGQKKQEMLDAMGGVVALGKGFMKYAQQKFNDSQLGAISAAARDYGAGGFTLVKGPPGTGKTTTLVALLNSLHIRQFNKYYDAVKQIATATGKIGGKQAALGIAAKAKPRLLVCAPSNAAVDNIILKIMEEGFVDGHGMRYNPSIIRVGVGQSNAVKDVALVSEVNSLISEGSDIAKVESAIAGYKMELQRVHKDIGRFRHRIHAILKAAPYPLSHSWEIRIYEETFEQTGQIYFVNHNEKRTTFEVPPPPEPGEPQFPATSMPEYRTYIAGIVKLVEKYNTLTTKLERYTLVLNFANTIASGGHSSQAAAVVRMNLETHILDSVHIVMTTLGTAGNRALESAAKFEVVVVDEAAQSVEPATLTALQLGSSHSILVGDPQQLPATIFSLSGRTTKYDRSLFQRLEEAGHEVHLLNTQYRMHPDISDFPRRIFYDGNLLDGPNVKHPDYGNPLRRIITQRVPALTPFTVLDLDSSEERGGTSLANSGEARLAVHLYQSLFTETGGLSGQSKVAVITPYSQQASLLHRMFSKSLGPHYANRVEINTVDAFQGREANIVIFSCVRAAGSTGIGFLSDVRRMNVALTRAKHFLFVIARCQSIVVNPYWRDLVAHAQETGAVVPVHMPMKKDTNFSDIKRWRALRSPSQIPPALPKRKRPDMDRKPIVSILKKQKLDQEAKCSDDVEYESGEEVSKPLSVLEKTNNEVKASGVESSDEDYQEMF